MIENPLISIITVSYNNHDVTCDFLKSVAALSYKNIEVIVVDNASVINPRNIYRSAFNDLRFIRSDINLGFAGGNNLGIKISKGEFLFFVNNDTTLTKNVLEGLIEIFNDHPDAGAASPKVYQYFKPNLLEYAGFEAVSELTGKNKMIGYDQIDSGQFDQIRTTAYAHGGAMMVPRKVIEQVGMMPELYFLYYEELDWCEMIKRQNYNIYYQPKSAIYHKYSMSSGKESVIKTYYLNRNRILFMRRNRPLAKLLIFYGYFIGFTLPKNILVFVINKKWQHLEVFFKSIFWHFTQLHDPINQPPGTHKR